MKAPEQGYVFKIDSVCFKYPKSASSLFDKLEFEISENEVVGVTGPSGSGKTTLLRLLSCLEVPEHGEILFEGKKLSRLEKKTSKELSSKIGMSFQRGGLIDWFSVSGNIDFALKELTQLNSSQRAELTEEALQKVGLYSARNQRLKELSGGMLKRLSLARAIALKPTVLLLDEPTAGLDPVTSSEILELINSYRLERKATVVLVSTDLSVLYSLARKIGVLWLGKFVQVGSLEELRQSSHPMVRQFILGQLNGPLTVKAHARD